VPEVLDFCRANGIDYILGVAPTSTLRRHVETLEASTKARSEATSGVFAARIFQLSTPCWAATISSAALCGMSIWRCRNYSRKAFAIASGSGMGRIEPFLPVQRMIRLGARRRCIRCPERGAMPEFD
jgi:hypothetical protein